MTEFKSLGNILLDLEVRFRMDNNSKDANRKFLQFTQDLEQIYSIIAASSNETSAFRIIIDECLKSLLPEDKRYAANYDIAYVKKDGKVYALARTERSGEGGGQLAVYPYLSPQLKKSKHPEEIDKVTERLCRGIADDFSCEKAYWHFADGDEQFFKSSEALFGVGEIFCADEDYIGVKLKKT